MRVILRKYSFIAYWAAFAVYTLNQAQYPGLVAYPDQWTYPWEAVFVVWGLLAALVGVFYMILRPMSFHWSWGRLLAALVLGAVLLGCGIASIVTDMPGYYYVPAMFSLVTMVLLVLFALTLALVRIFGNRKYA